MSEHLKTARHWMTEADKGRMQSGVPTLDDLGKAVWRIILHLESQAAQTAESQAQPATTGTTPSSAATEPTADAPNGSSTFSETYSLAKADPLGDWRTTVTVTFHEPNFTPIPGVALRHWQDAGWTVQTLSTWGSPSPSGATPSTIPEHEADGRTAGGSEKSPDPSPSGAPGEDAAGIPSASGRECSHSWQQPVRSLAHGFDLLNDTDMHPKTGEHLWWCERCGAISWHGAAAFPHPAKNVQPEPATPTPAPESGEKWEVLYDTHSGYYVNVPGEGAVVDGKEEYIRRIVADHNASIAAPERDHRTRAAIAFIREVVQDARSSNFTDRANWGGRGQIILDAFAARPASAEEVGS